MSGDPILWRVCAVLAGCVAGCLLRVLLRRGCGPGLAMAARGWPWAGQGLARGRAEGLGAVAALSLSLSGAFHDPVLCAGSLLFLTGLLTLALIDIECGLLPDRLTQPLLWAGLLYHLAFGRVALAEAVLGAAVGYLSLWLLYWGFFLCCRREGLGLGDAKLLAALGAWLGVSVLPQLLLLSALTGLLAGGILMLSGQMRRKDALPFGPFLACAGWVAWIGGERFREWMSWQSRWWG